MIALPASARPGYHQLLRDWLPHFIRAAFEVTDPGTQFMPHAYINLLASRLQDCLEGRCRRLIINLPPRYLKSHIINAAVAWWLGSHPSYKFICVSYGEKLAETMSDKTRDIMESALYQTLYTTRLSRSTSMLLSTAQKGYRMATSVGGVITGYGADCIIVDDPLKAEDALSDNARARVNEWYSNSLVSRLNNKREGAIIVVMQRLHVDDLVGHLLSGNKSDWEVVALPAVAQVDESFEYNTHLGKKVYRRSAGEALHEEREPLAMLLQLRDQMSEYLFSAQYQQSPVPIGGGLVKTEWLKYYQPAELDHNFDHIIQSWDTANTAAQTSNYSVGTTWGLKGDKIYLLDVFRQRLEYPDLKGAVMEQAKLHRATLILIEDKGSGTQLIQELARAGSKVEARKPNKDKPTRLHGQTAAIKQGLAQFPVRALWLTDYVHELTSFPQSRNDDQVDSTSQMLEWHAEYLGRKHHLFEADFGYGDDAVYGPPIGLDEQLIYQRLRYRGLD